MVPLSNLVGYLYNRVADGGPGPGATGEGGLRGEHLDHGDDVAVTQGLGGRREGGGGEIEKTALIEGMVHNYCSLQELRLNRVSPYICPRAFYTC